MQPLRLMLPIPQDLDSSCVHDFSAIACSMAVSLLLPPIHRSKYPSYDPVNQETGQNLDTLVDGKAVRGSAEVEVVPTPASSPSPLKKFISDLITAFGCKNVVAWSLWLILVSCGVTQVSNFSNTEKIHRIHRISVQYK